MEICEARIEYMVATMEVVPDATARIGGKFEVHTSEMTTLVEAGLLLLPQSAKG